MLQIHSRFVYLGMYNQGNFMSLNDNKRYWLTNSLIERTITLCLAEK